MDRHGIQLGLHRGHVCGGLRWSRLFGQIFRLDKWIVCRGRCRSTTSIERLKVHINAFIDTHDEDAEPFVRTKSKVYRRLINGAMSAAYDSGYWRCYRPPACIAISRSRTNPMCALKW